MVFEPTPTLGELIRPICLGRISIAIKTAMMARLAPIRAYVAGSSALAPFLMALSIIPSQGEIAAEKPSQKIIWDA